MGRPKGSKNKASAAAREAFATWVDGSFGRFEEWVKRVARKDPRGAADLYLRAAEFHVGKQGRIEIAGDQEKPIRVRFGLD